MKKYMSEYIKSSEIFIADRETKSPDEISAFLKEFEIKISYFQHERLIHLIVTVLFALLEVISMYAFIMTFNKGIGILCLMFMVLLIPYIMHYYFLENSVQKMYVMRDQLLA